MSDNPGYGFVPFPNSSKKELPEPPKASAPVVNNYFTLYIDPRAVLFAALLVVFIIATIRLGPMGLKA
jgi:hypothetical protein